MRITINEKADRVLEKIKNDCKAREISREAFLEIVSEALIAVPAEFWKGEIDRQTSPNFFLKQAMRDPKIAKQVMDFLKQKSKSPELAADSREPAQ